MLPTSPSQVRQNYRPECEAAINSHAALEFHASFHCLHGICPYKTSTCNFLLELYHPAIK
uniref:Uncharacterized protein n=1 Tax=Bos indicus x Bos taurus TaxID=30522 RepID=A0A4W2HU72_BOBOX